MRKEEIARWIHLISVMKAAEIWFHSAHFLTKGRSFVSDHRSLYGEIYESYGEWYDSIVEKSLSLCQDEIVADPQVILENSSRIISSDFISPVDASQEDLAKGSLVVLVNSIAVIDVMREKKMFTAGADNLLSGIQDKIETYLYFFRQKLKA